MCKLATGTIFVRIYCRRVLLLWGQSLLFMELPLNNKIVCTHSAVGNMSLIVLNKCILSIFIDLIELFFCSARDASNICRRYFVPIYLYFDKVHYISLRKWPRFKKKISHTLLFYVTGYPYFEQWLLCYRWRRLCTVQSQVYKQSLKHRTDDMKNYLRTIPYNVWYIKKLNESVHLKANMATHKILWDHLIEHTHQMPVCIRIVCLPIFQAIHAAHKIPIVPVSE